MTAAPLIVAGIIARQPWMRADAVFALFRALFAGGGQARLVGGCVRDAVAGRAVGDIDVATPTRPAEVIRLLDAARIRALPTGLAHGTVTAAIAGSSFEITTLRRDVETDGRHAVVAFTDDWAADAERRDFTMNALFCDLDGSLYDPVGGLADLHAGRVRFIGDGRRRLAEDVLRLLRFFRFHAWYGAGPPDADGTAACRAFVPRLRGLAAERVWSELTKTLRAPAPAAAFGLMDGIGALDEVLGVPRRPDRLAAAVDCEAALGLEPSAVRRLAAMLDCDTAAAAALAGRLRLPRKSAERLTAAIENGPKLARAHGEPAIRDALYRWGAPAFADALVSAVAGRGAVPDWAGCASALADWVRPIFPLSGSDVLAAGVPEGPAVGRSLRAIEDWWLDVGCEPDRRACLDRLAASLDM